MEPTRAEAYVQKLKELNAFMAGMIQSINKDASLLEAARMESRKHFSTAKVLTNQERSLKPILSSELFHNWQTHQNWVTRKMVLTLLLAAQQKGPYIAEGAFLVSLAGLV